MTATPAAPENSAPTGTLPFALFRHDDGSWYRLWMTQADPKTARGHRWHLHATYDKTGTIAPVGGTRWWDLPYGMANWVFVDEEEARAAFRERAEQRLRRGYKVAEGGVP